MYSYHQSESQDKCIKIGKEEVSLILVVCSTPFQILNLLTMKDEIFQNQKVDVVILNHAAVNYSLFQKLKDMDAFDTVYFAETKHVSNGGDDKDRWVRDLTELQHILNKDYVLDQVNLSRTDYDQVVVASEDPPSQIFWYYIKANNPKAKLYIFEDGTKTYSFFDRTYSKFKPMYLKRIYGNEFFEEIEGAYLHHPKYYRGKEGLDLVQTPPIDKSNLEIRELINSVFNYEKEEGAIPFQQRFVYFDQAYQFSEELTEQARLHQLVEKIVGEDQLVVKLHPRTDANYYTNYLKGNYPFEVLELNQNIEEKVLISGLSTACLTPKLVFDEEPYVIILYQLFESGLFKENQRGNFELAQRIKADYRNPERFMIPENETELVEMLKKLTN